MHRDRGSDQVEEVFSDVLEDDEPAVREGEVGVGQTRRMGGDVGAAQAVQAGAAQAPGVAAEREGQAQLPPERGRPGEAGAPPDSAPGVPPTLDPTRSDVDRNAAGGGWAGVSEVLENDYESEQLRRRQAERESGTADPDEGAPPERMRP